MFGGMSTLIPLGD